MNTINRSIEFTPQGSFKFTNKELTQHEALIYKEIESILGIIEEHCGNNILKKLSYITGTDQNQLSILKAILETKYKPENKVYKFTFENNSKVVTNYRGYKDEDLSDLYKNGFRLEEYGVPQFPGLLILNSDGTSRKIPITGIMMLLTNSRDFVFEEDETHSSVFFSLRHPVNLEMIMAYNEEKLFIGIA